MAVARLRSARAEIQLKRTRTYHCAASGSEIIRCGASRRAPLPAPSVHGSTGPNHLGRRCLGAKPRILCWAKQRRPPEQQRHRDERSDMGKYICVVSESGPTFHGVDASADVQYFAVVMRNRSPISGVDYPSPAEHGCPRTLRSQGLTWLPSCAPRGQVEPHAVGAEFFGQGGVSDLGRPWLLRPV